MTPRRALLRLLRAGALASAALALTVGLAHGGATVLLAEGGGAALRYPPGSVVTGTLTLLASESVTLLTKSDVVTLRGPGAYTLEPGAERRTNGLEGFFEYLRASEGRRIVAATRGRRDQGAGLPGADTVDIDGGGPTCVRDLASLRLRRKVGWPSRILLERPATGERALFRWTGNAVSMPWPEGVRAVPGGRYRIGPDDGRPVEFRLHRLDATEREPRRLLLSLVEHRCFVQAEAFVRRLTSRARP